MALSGLVLAHLETGLCANPESAFVQSQPPSALVEAASGSDADAQFRLGMWYFRKSAGATNRFGPRFQAVRWLRKAAEAGNHDKAQFYLGVAYLDGLGVERDRASALEWFRKAAGQCLAEAQLNLGLLRAEGMTPTGGDEDAAQLVRKAADQGLAEAHFIMAVLGAEGERFPGTEVSASECYQRALTNAFAGGQILAGVQLETSARKISNRGTAATQLSSEADADAIFPSAESLQLRHLNVKGAPDDPLTATNWWANALSSAFASRRFAAMLRLPGATEPASFTAAGRLEVAWFPRRGVVPVESPESSSVLGTSSAAEVMERFPSLGALDHFLRTRGYEPTPPSGDEATGRRRGESIGEYVMRRQLVGVPLWERRFIEEVRGMLAARDGKLAPIREEIPRFVAGPRTYIRQAALDEGAFEREFRLKYGTSPLDWYLGNASPDIKLEEILNVVSRLYPSRANHVVEAIQLVRLITRHYSALDSKNGLPSAKERQRDLDSYRIQIGFFLSGQMGPKTTHTVLFDESAGGFRLIEMIDEFDNSRPVRKRADEEVAEVSALYNTIAKHKGWPELATGRIDVKSVTETLKGTDRP